MVGNVYRMYTHDFIVESHINKYTRPIHIHKHPHHNIGRAVVHHASMHTCTCTHTRTHAHAHMHTRTHTHTHTHAHAHAHTHTHTHTHTHAHTHTHTS